MKKFVFHDEVTQKPVPVFYRKTYDGVWIHFQGEVSFHPLPVLKEKFQESDLKASGDVKSFLPGKILDVRVKEGDKVKKGEVLLVLEAMKMEYEIISPRQGYVEKLFCTKEEQVQQNTLLARII